MTKMEQLAKNNPPLRAVLNDLETTFNNLLEAHWYKLVNDPNIIEQVNDPETLVRWDFYRASCAAATQRIFYDLGLNDTHVDSYLRSLVRKWKA